MKLQTCVACLCLIAFSTAAPSAVAQGKIRFVNDSLHLVYFNSDPSWLPVADAFHAGQPVPAGGVTYSGITLAADLWGGTSSSSLVKLTSTTFDASPGLLNGISITTPFDLGATLYFEVQVYDAAAGSFWAAAERGTYYGRSSVFTTVASSTGVYSSIINPNSPAFSTWAPGGWNLDASTYGVGARGAIQIQMGVPEPGSAALLCLGTAWLMLVRRRGSPTRPFTRAR